jgi:hypothetical protein
MLPGYSGLLGSSMGDELPRREPVSSPRIILGDEAYDKY